MASFCSIESAFPCCGMAATRKKKYQDNAFLPPSHVVQALVSPGIVIYQHAVRIIWTVKGA